MPSGFVTATNVGIGARLDLLLSADQGEQTARDIKRPSRLSYAIDSDQTDVVYEIRVGSSLGSTQVVGRSQVPSGGTLSVMPDLQAAGITVLLPTGTLVVEVTGGAAAADINFPFQIVPIR